jgi:hypothetical protein
MRMSFTKIYRLKRSKRAILASRSSQKTGLKLSRLLGLKMKIIKPKTIRKLKTILFDKRERRKMSINQVVSA